MRFPGPTGKVSGLGILSHSGLLNRRILLCHTHRPPPPTPGPSTLVAPQRHTFLKLEFKEHSFERPEHPDLHPTTGHLLASAHTFSDHPRTINLPVRTNACHAPLQEDKTMFQNL